VQSSRGTTTRFALSARGEEKEILWEGVGRKFAREELIVRHKCSVNAGGEKGGRGIDSPPPQVKARTLKGQLSGTEDGTAQQAPNQKHERQKKGKREG